MTNNVFWTKKVKQKTKNKKSKENNHCQSRELNPGLLAQQSDALPLNH